MKAIQKIKSNLSKITKVLRHGLFLSLYSYIKKVSGKLPWRSRTSTNSPNSSSSLSSSALSSSSISSYIRSLRNVRIAGMSSSIMFGLLALAIIIPLYNVSGTEDTEAATGTAKDSEIVFSSTRDTAAVNLTPNSTSGTFASTTYNSTDAAFDIYTTNSQGYELKIKSTSSNTTMKTSSSAADSTGLSTIASSRAEGSFTTNTWGYLPNYYDCDETKGACSTNSSTYYPITTNDVTLRKTATANSSNDRHYYYIGIGAKADLTRTNGTYTLGGNNGTMTLSYVANPTGYEITYADNSGDSTVSNMPTTTQFGAVSATSIALAPNRTPTRTGYSLTGWCLGEVTSSGTTCSGTTIATNGSLALDRTATSNKVILYAVWTANTYTVNFYSNLYQINGESLVATLDGRTFTKTNAGNALVAYLYGGTYTGPVIVSTTSNAVTFTTGPDHVVTNGSSGNFTQGGVKYYYSSDGSWMQGDFTNTMGVAEKKYSNLSLSGAAQQLLTDTKTNLKTQSFVYGAAQKLTSNSYSRAGYTFKGWSTTPTGSVIYTNAQSVSNLATSGSVDLYAIWEENSYTVNYYSNPYQVSAKSLVVTLNGRTYTKINTGNTLVAYTYNGNCTGPVVVGGTADSVKLATGGNHTSTIISGGSFAVDGKAYYYAQDGSWICADVTNASGMATKKYPNLGVATAAQQLVADSKVNLKTQTFKYGVPQTLTSNTYTRTGFTFKGWSTTPTGDVMYNNSQTAFNLTGSSSIDLYAIWGENTYTVNFYSNPYQVYSKPLICTLSGRTYTKTNAGNALVGYFYNTDKYTGPLVVSNTSANVIYTTGGGYNATLNAQGTISSGGATYTDSQSAYNLAASGTVDLYAIWTEASYTQTTQVRYQNADGTWTGYSTVDSKSVPYGETYSWSRAADATYKAASASSYMVTGAKTNSVDVYRQYIRSDIVGKNLQDVTHDQLFAVLPNTGDTITLKDSRDNQEYLVGKLADGKIWLLENLRLSTRSVQLNSSNTNVASGYTWTLPASSMIVDNSYTVAMVNSDNANLELTNNDYTAKNGVYYNFCAASAGTYCYASGDEQGNNTHDICPAGWRLPTGVDATSEFTVLLTAYNNNATNYINALRIIYAGNQGDGIYWGDSRYAYYSTSSYKGAGLMGGVSVTKSSSIVDTYGYFERDVGGTIRCIFKR